MQPKLTSEFWVAAYLRRLSLKDIPAYVITRGDNTSGAILVRVSTLDGYGKIFTRNPSQNGQQIWTEIAHDTDAALNERIAKEQRFDPDLWVLELEDRSGRHLLEEDGF